jgi:hypothetical protein
MAATLIWKLVLAAALGAGIFASALIRPPRRSFPGADLRVMLLAALGLYCVGLGASLTHHGIIAAAVYACGISISALAVWLSRGRDHRELPPDDEPPDGPPPAGPDDPTEFDWEAFERQLGVYADRQRTDRRPEREPALPR